ncbi:MAG TPA: potassium channel family protein [Bradyrhizobium sp.]|nr:potassium channel family protein [Bradyrhizobium sp.]
MADAKSSPKAWVFIAFNAVFAVFYWIGNQPISNVPGGAYIDYLYFSIETLSTASYGDMHPQTLYGHLIATVELFTGVFSMSLMTGLIFARLRGSLSHSCHVNIIWETSRERAK